MFKFAAYVVSCRFTLDMKQKSLSSFLVKTTFEIAVIFFANGCAGFLSDVSSQNVIIHSAVFLPS